MILQKRANEQIHNSIPIPREEAKEKNAAKFRVVVSHLEYCNLKSCMTRFKMYLGVKHF